MVGDVGNAPTTSAMSMLRSTSELFALNNDPLLSHIDSKNRWKIYLIDNPSRKGAKDNLSNLKKNT